MGDFSANFHRPSAGIHTVEGNVAGSRAATLSRKREADQEAFEQRKKKIASDAERGKLGIDAKFDADSKLSKSEAEFRSKTVGLVTAEEFKKATREAEEMKKKKVVGLFDIDDDDDDDGGDGGGRGKASSATGGIDEAELTEEERKKLEKQRKKARKKALKKKKKALSALSFVGAEDADGIVDDADVDDINPTGGTELKKNPEVDTSFLPDKDREAAAEAERLRLRREWVRKQKQMQEEMLDITYSYWDGSGHRRNVRCKKGDTIADFLELVRKDLSKEFREIANVGSDALRKFNWCAIVSTLSASESFVGHAAYHVVSISLS